MTVDGNALLLLGQRGRSDLPRLVSVALQTIQVERTVSGGDVVPVVAITRDTRQEWYSENLEDSI